MLPCSLFWWIDWIGIRRGRTVGVWGIVNNNTFTMEINISILIHLISSVRINISTMVSKVFEILIYCYIKLSLNISKNPDSSFNNLVLVDVSLVPILLRMNNNQWISISYFRQ